VNFFLRQSRPHRGRPQIGTVTVTGIAVNTGGVGGGTAVTVTGTGFTPGAFVSLAGQLCTSVNVINATTITCISPAGNPGLADLSVLAAGGAAMLPNAFTYIQVSVSNVTANVGGIGGGTAVTIAGTGFASGATVSFGGAAATSVVVVDPNTITCITPAHASGAVTVQVTDTYGAGSLGSGFTYLQVTVTGIAPSSGSTAGGTAVTITGTNFVSGATVAIGGVACTSVVVVDPTTITCVTGAHAAGAGDVVVIDTYGSGTLAAGFTYTAGGAGPLDWNSDLANSPLGISDIVDATGHAAKWGDTTGTGTANLSVVDTPSGGPSGLAHCWQCILSATARMVRTTVGKFTSPSVGHSRWFRTEMRFDFTNGVNTGSMHPIQVDGFGDLHYTWKMLGMSGGFIQFRIHIDPLVSSNGAFDLVGVIAANTWYELEWELFRSASGILKIRTINIRDMAGTVVATAHEFINANDGTTRFDAANPDVTFTDATVQDYWQGNNGPGGATEGPLFYFGGTATLLDASCGRYSAGRG
jgi:hypothetical protein